MVGNLGHGWGLDYHPFISTLYYQAEPGEEISPQEIDGTIRCVQKLMVQLLRTEVDSQWLCESLDLWFS